jgi:hypothetical protein
MDSDSVRPWQRALAIQRFEIPAKHVLSTVSSRSAEVDQQKQIISKMAGKMPGKSNDGEEK